MSLTIGKNGRPLRPCPADFPRLAAVKNMKQLRAHFRASEVTIQRWFAEHGIKQVRPSSKMATPADFHLHYMETNAVLSARYGCSEKTILRFRRDTGLIVSRNAHNIRRMPDEFPTEARGMTIERIMARWDVCSTVARRWRNDAGLPPVLATRFKPSQPKTWGTTPAMKTDRVMGMADFAARELMRFYNGVYRASTRDPSAPDDLWIVGRLQLTEEQMLQKAVDRCGWKMAA